jgi:hypothetical protein
MRIFETAMRRAHRVHALVAALALSACHASHPPPPAQASPGLEQAVRENLDGGAEYQQVGEILRGVAPEEDALLSWQVALEGNRCYVFSAVGDRTVDELKIYIFNPNEEKVFTRRRPGQKSVVGQFCVDGGVFLVPPGVLLSRPR